MTWQHSANTSSKCPKDTSMRHVFSKQPCMLTQKNDYDVNQMAEGFCILFSNPWRLMALAHTDYLIIQL